MDAFHKIFAVFAFTLVSTAACREAGAGDGNCADVAADYNAIGTTLYEGGLAIKIGGHWAPLKGSHVLQYGKWTPLDVDLLGNHQARFAYRIDHRRGQRDEGVVIVKTSNKKTVRIARTPEEIDKVLPNTKVLLNRSRYLDICEGKDHWHPTRRTVRVSYGNYVRYHKWEEVGNSVDFTEMKNFHLSYLKKTIAGTECIRTDDPDSGNRFRFLFDGTRRVTFREAFVRKFSLVAGSAIAEPPVPKLSVRMIRYKALSEESRCVYFRLSDLDNSTLIQINDLESPSDVNFGYDKD